MVFNSIDFLLFFPVVYLLYLRINHKKQNILLLVASYFFYGYWDYRFLSLLFLSTIIDYYASISIEANWDNPQKKKYFLYLSIFSNLTILGFFKYFKFFVKSAVAGFSSIGIQVNEPVLNIILPLGISFYTFQTMSYTIDVYRGDLKPTRNFLDFALFVTFFPQLVAGPIERATNLLPQILNPRTVTFEKVSQGSFLILFGLYKKVYIADNLATIVDPIFLQNPESIAARTGAEAIIGCFAFLLQIYCDFAGYSDIARGIAKFMGVELIRNFNHPFFARDFNDFWRRWHTSFMNWLRDYVYVPLSKTNNSEFRNHVNMMIVFLLSGFWHGANWTFIMWGFSLGVIASVYRIARRLNPNKEVGERKNPGALTWIFHAILADALVIFTCVFFRAEELSTGFIFWKKMFVEFGTIDPKILGKFFKLIIPLFLIELYQFKKDNEFAFFELKTVYRVLFYLFLFYSIIIMGNNKNAFIYFVF
ncbi:MAG TPA: MBOAT family O-acyltransferase [Leptospiraceae bacterium]|nr:MBOAT family O-acyltransferase [Leptospiraceae bacterium]HMW03710.1 MBOAT family O-acyltransferase [Leptospiraceae bacterium]HMX34903.1 MBOAT family O-acyltransferase [Leptospiraceae bacterium]HMY29690.1 MBOAT family O-acyltransferase [Leptospiraceae bacterium]HMZ64034.1 MBOAT family O-acyltransferase [Leptospiraceae bacterium]